MRITIYLDILFLLNFFVTFLLLKSTARLANDAPRKHRLFLGSLLGGVYSLLILFDVRPALLVVLKLAMGASLLLTVFFRRGQGRRLGKTALLFCLVNFIFAGFMYALWMFAPPDGMNWKNGVAYFNVSALSLAISTSVAYLLLTLFSLVLNKRTRTNELSELTLGLLGRQVRLTAFTDTGNKLTDIFTGLPVIVCEYSAVEALFPERVRGFFENPGSFSFEGVEAGSYAKLFRVLPVDTSAGDGLLPAFRPDRTAVNGHEVQAVVAVTRRALSDGNFRALLHPALLE